MSNSKTKKTRVAKIKARDGYSIVINRVKQEDDLAMFELFIDGGTLPNGEEREEFFSISEAMAYAAEIVELTFEELEDE